MKLNNINSPYCLRYISNNRTLVLKIDSNFTRKLLIHLKENKKKILNIQFSKEIEGNFDHLFSKKIDANEDFNFCFQIHKEFIETEKKCPWCYGKKHYLTSYRQEMSICYQCKGTGKKMDEKSNLAEIVFVVGFLVSILNSIKRNNQFWIEIGEKGAIVGNIELTHLENSIESIKKLSEITSLLKNLFLYLEGCYQFPSFAPHFLENKVFLKINEKKNVDVSFRYRKYSMSIKEGHIETQYTYVPEQSILFLVAISELIEIAS